jgi:hypothetical protein
VNQVSAPVRVVGLVGVLAALAVGGWAFMAGRSATTQPTPAGVGTVAANPIAAAQSVAGKLSAHNVATAQGRPDATAAAPAAPAAAAKPKAAAAPAKAAATPAAAPAPAPAAAPAKKAAPKQAAPNATPGTIASLLKQYPAVVVLLYDPRTSVDDYSVAEAQLGAKTAHAGFVRVDVMNQRQAGPFTQAYGVLEDPTLLFYARPGKLVQKLSGFADHETVTQGALNAALGLGSSSSLSAAAAPTG